MSKTVNISTTEIAFGKGVSRSKTAQRRDLSVFSASAWEKVAIVGELHGHSAAITLPERRDTPLSHAIVSQIADTAVLPSTRIPSETPAPKDESEHSPSSIPLSSDVQHRTFSGEAAARGADNAFAEAGRQPLPSEAILRNIGNAA
ncbi:MAG: hypothetical protein ACR5LF_05665 [Symbiopectobacterium sp.]